MNKPQLSLVDSQDLLSSRESAFICHVCSGGHEGEEAALLPVWAAMFHRNVIVICRIKKCQTESSMFWGGGGLKLKFENQYLKKYKIQQTSGLQRAERAGKQCKKGLAGL